MIKVVKGAIFCLFMIVTSGFLARKEMITTDTQLILVCIGLAVQHIINCND